MNYVKTDIEVDRQNPDNPDSSPALATLLIGFGTYEDRERESIQWVESLSPAEGDAVLSRAIEEWDQIVKENQSHA